MDPCPGPCASGVRFPVEGALGEDAGLLVVGLLTGFGGSDQAGAAKEPRATVGKIMIPAAAFAPTNNSWEYGNGGYFLSSYPGNVADFIAPLSFPVPVVNIRRIMLLAYDNTGDSNDVCIHLLRAEPLKASESTAGGNVCTVNSTTDPQKVATNAISHRRMNTANHGPYLWAPVDPGTKLYGVQVVYSY